MEDDVDNVLCMSADLQWSRRYIFWTQNFLSYAVNCNILQRWQTAQSHPEVSATCHPSNLYTETTYVNINKTTKKHLENARVHPFKLNCFICGMTLLRITYVTLVLSKELVLRKEGILRKQSKTALPYFKKLPKMRNACKFTDNLPDYKKKKLNELPYNTSPIVLDSQINIFYYICQDKTQQCCFKQHKSILSSDCSLQQIIFL